MIAVVALAFLAFACAQNDTNDDASKKILIAVSAARAAVGIARGLLFLHMQRHRVARSPAHARAAQGQYVFEEDGWELFIASRIALDNVVLHRSVSLVSSRRLEQLDVRPSELTRVRAQ